MEKQIKQHMSKAYDYLRLMAVSHDNVKLLAMAEQEIENAFRTLEQLEAERKEQQGDGQTD